MKSFNIKLFTAFLFILAIFLSTDLTSQSLDGIYSDGEVSLHLEEDDNGVYGVFIDTDGSSYEVFFIGNEDGLLGSLGEFAAFIPWDSENMILYIMPVDENDTPLFNQAVQIELDYVAELQEYVDYVDISTISWTPIKRFGSDFYPSYVLATSTSSDDTSYEIEESNYKYYGDQNGYFGFYLENFPIGSIVHVEVEGEPLARNSTYSTTITHEGINEIFPVIEYDYEALKNVQQAKPVNFKYRVFIDDQLFEEKLETVWVRSVNDAMTFFIDHHGNEYKIDYIFAAYVNENEPSLDPILGQALDYGIINSWGGYQGSEEDVIDQVFTLWHHFQKQGFRYSNITTQSGSDDRSFGQVVRFVKDALNTTQANCIDGTVLFASFLYKIGLKVSIVLVPGHAYLAFGLDEEGSRMMALETTMMGDLNIEHSDAQQGLYQAKQGMQDDLQKSWSSFLGALEAGTNDYKENVLPGIQNGDPKYMEIDIATARKNKIRPIK